MKLVSIQEAARRTGVKPNTISQYAARGHVQKYPDQYDKQRFVIDLDEFIAKWNANPRNKPVALQSQHLAEES